MKVFCVSNPFSRKKQDPISSQEKEGGLYLPSHLRLGSCVTHRPEIVWIDISAKKEDILTVIRNNPSFTCFPVCSGTVDSVLGVLPARSFLDAALGPTWPGLRSLLVKPLYLPETATILSAITLFVETGSRMAFIIDEYGGIEGLVTKNGLISELLTGLGSVPGDEKTEIFQREDGTWLVDGQIRMTEIRERFDLPDDQESAHEYYTLAGYLLSRKGSIPKTGDTIRAGSYLCEIVDMDGHRIDKVLIADLGTEADTGDEAGK